MRKLQAIVGVVAALLTTSCGFTHDETLVGPYRLVAVDADEQMGLCWSVPNTNGDCVGDGLPSDTVYAAGYDQKYLVAAVHPTALGRPVNRSITQYYYIVRSKDDFKEFPRRIIGPMDGAQFDAAKAALHLPGFSRVFDDLK